MAEHTAQGCSGRSVGTACRAKISAVLSLETRANPSVALRGIFDVTERGQVKVKPESPQLEAPVTRRSSVLPMLAVLILTAALFAVVCWYLGGIDGISSLVEAELAPKPSEVVATSTVSPAPAVSVGATETTAAKLVYAEQIESQENIDKLADGDVASFRVDSAKVASDSAIVRITIKMHDGTSAPGALRFVRSGELWYFATITGLRSSRTGGEADEIGSSESVTATITADEKLAAVGVEVPDADVIRVIAEQQVINQPLVRDLIAGEYQWYTLGKPVNGPYTFTIPVKFGGSEETTIAGAITIIAKNVEGQDRLFITTFKRD